MKRNDLILILIIVIVAACGLLYINLSKDSGDKVVIEVDGEIYKELPLNEDTKVEIKGVNNSTNLLVIKDGHADIIDASCPDKICVHQTEIQYDGESLICLPNKVIVRIESSKQSDADIIAN